LLAKTMDRFTESFVTADLRRAVSGVWLQASTWERWVFRVEDRPLDAASGQLSVGMVRKSDHRADHGAASLEDPARAETPDRAAVFAVRSGLRTFVQLSRLANQFCLAASTLEEELPGVFLYLRSPSPLECVCTALRTRMVLGNNH
jgi:hypothetical protein